MAADGMVLTNHDHQIRVGILTGKGNVFRTDVFCVSRLFCRLSRRGRLSVCCRASASSMLREA